MRLLARRSGTLNVNSHHAVKVLDLVRLKASSGAIEAAVCQSPQLAINLIKLASSPAFAAKEVRSVKFAIELLGWRELENLMLTLIASWLANASKDVQIIDGQKMRERSLVQAFVARCLAKPHLPQQADALYTAGLFLDVGYLLLATHEPALLYKLKRTCERTPGLDLLEAETEILGFTHAELSAVLGEELKLGTTAIECLRYHHTPIDASVECQTAADVCCVASGLADALELDAVPGLARAGHDDFACKRLRIEPDDLAEVVDTLTSKALSVANVLGESAKAA